MFHFLPCAPVAQLDRALDYGSRGREFESSPARHKILRNYAIFEGFLFSSIPSNSLVDYLLTTFWIFSGFLTAVRKIIFQLSNGGSGVLFVHMGINICGHLNGRMAQ